MPNQSPLLIDHERVRQFLPTRSFEIGIGSVSPGIDRHGITGRRIQFGKIVADRVRWLGADSNDDDAAIAVLFLHLAEVGNAIPAWHARRRPKIDDKHVASAPALEINWI